MRWNDIIADTSADILERNLDKHSAENNAAMMGLSVQKDKDRIQKVEDEIISDRNPTKAQMQAQSMQTSVSSTVNNSDFAGSQ